MHLLDQPIITPDPNFICGYQLPSPPPPPSTPFYCIPYCGQSSTVPGACVSHISSTSKSNIFHLLIPVWVFETEDRMAFARVTQVRLVKFFISKTGKIKCKLIKFLFEFKTRGECKPLSKSFLKQEEIIKIYAAHEDCSTQTNSKHGKRGLIYGTLTSISAFSEGLKMNKKTQLKNSWFRFRT